MGIFEIISAIVLILASIFIIVVVIFQDTDQGMSQTITGSSGDNYFKKNSGRSKEARIKRATLIAAVTFFVVAVVVNLANLYAAKKPSETPETTTSSITTETTIETTAETTIETTVETGDTSDTDSPNGGETEE